MIFRTSKMYTTPNVQGHYLTMRLNFEHCFPQVMQTKNTIICDIITHQIIIYRLCGLQYRYNHNFQFG